MNSPNVLCNLANESVIIGYPPKAAVGVGMGCANCCVFCSKAAIPHLGTRSVVGGDEWHC